MHPAVPATPSTTNRPAVLRVLAHAAIRRTSAILRSLRGTPPHPLWQSRAALCATCPIARRVGNDLYCGKPLLQSVHRQPEDGCGCPVVLKAQDPAEHCPLNSRFAPAHTPPSTHPQTHPHTPIQPCDCRWCTPSALKPAKPQPRAA